MPSAQMHATSLASTWTISIIETPSQVAEEQTAKGKIRARAASSAWTCLSTLQHRSRLV
jgi:hypothetical protein